MTNRARRPLKGSGSDSLFLTFVVVLSSAAYLSGLGFYSDDWAWLGNASMSDDQSLLGIFDAILSDNVRMRPLQFFYFAGLYKVFGLDPLGYHLVNMLVLAAGAVLFYRVLRELGEPRRLSLAVPIVYVLLPHFATDRFWPSAYSTGLSMTLFFLSLSADLRAWRSGGGRRGWWKLLAVLALVASALSYEVFLPLFLLVPVVLWQSERRQAPVGWSQVRRVAVFTIPNLVGLAAALWYKLATTTRMDLGADDPVYHLRWFADLVASSFAVGFVDFGLALPVRLLQIVQARFDVWTFVMGGAVTLAVYLYLDRVVEPPETARRGRPEARGPFGPEFMTKLEERRFRKARAAVYGIGGLAVFLAGYSIFLTNYNAVTTATGSGNRIAIAGTVGVALCFVGFGEGVGAVLSTPGWRRRFFGAYIAFLAGAGVTICTAIAGFWVEAYDRELELLAEIRGDFPQLQDGTTILLDGGCPFIGPAVVFQSSWDLRWALILHYRSYALQADVITPTSRVEEAGITTSLYGVETRYPYGERLYVYDPRRDIIGQASDADAARRYFQEPGARATTCPEAEAGHGVPIF